MSEDSLKSRLRAALRPAGATEEAASCSDYDLNPDAERPDRACVAATVLVALVARPSGPGVILTRRADALSRHGGQIALPGGRIDPGETVVEAALREAWEEVALDPVSVEVLGLSDTYETVTGYRVTPVVGWLATPPALVASPDEVAEVFETPWDFLMDPANHRRDHLEAPDGARRWFWAMPWEDRYIWGATAGMLRALRRRLYSGAEGEAG